MKFEFMRKDYVANSSFDDAVQQQAEIKKNSYREVCVKQKSVQWIREEDNMFVVGTLPEDSIFITLNGAALLENCYSEKQFNLLLSNAFSILEMKSDRLICHMNVKSDFFEKNNPYLYSNQQNMVSALENMKDMEIVFIGEASILDKPKQSLVEEKLGFRWPWQKKTLAIT